MGRTPRLIPGLATLLLLLLLTSCGGRSTQTSGLDVALSPEQPAVSPEAPTTAELKALLMQEFARLGIDPDRVPSSPPSSDSNAVFDLQGSIEANDDGALVTLSWTERMIGDYDQNGLVNLSDITALGQNFLRTVEHDDSSLHEGRTNWPAGEPDDGGEGAANWRRARVDGNDDGLVNLADITPIAVHWNEALSGFRLYRKGPADSGFSPVSNPEDPFSPLTVLRVGATGNNPVRYSFQLQEADTSGVIEYQLKPFDLGSAPADFDKGSPSNVARVGFLRAVLQGDPQTGSPPLSVNLDASASFDANNNISLLEWDSDNNGVFLSDASTSWPDAFMEFTYSSKGIYHPAVRVHDLDGNMDVARITVVVSDPGDADPVAVLNSNPDPPLAAQAPLSVSFDGSASSDADGSIVDYEWDLDGDGTYNENDNGEQGAHGLPQVQHTYTAQGSYPVSLRVTDNDGRQGSAFVDVRIGEPPHADLQADPLSGNQDLEVHFDAGLSSGPVAALVEYSWDWDGNGKYDESSGLTSIVSHTYTKPGSYRATVRVKDAQGLTDTAFVMISVSNTPPLAQLEGTPALGNAPLEVMLDAGGSSDADGTISNYSLDYDNDLVWDYQGTESLQFHTFSDPGDQLVRLRVVDDDGAAATASFPLHVNIPPLASLLAAQDSNYAPFITQLDASGSIDPDGSIVNYEWDIDDDGLFSEAGNGEDLLAGLAQVSPVLDEAGGHTVRVRVTDNLGLSETAGLLLVVLPSSWQHSWGSSGDERPNVSVLQAGNGSLYVASYVNTGSAQKEDVVLLCYGTDGTLHWTRSWGGTEEDYPVGLALDLSGNLLLAGRSVSYSAGSAAGFILKYDPDGSLLWQKLFDKSASQQFSGIAVAGSGNIIVCGDYQIPGNAEELFVMALDSGAQILWQKLWGGSGVESGNGITVDDTGNIYVAGNTTSYGEGQQDIVLLKFNPEGTLLAQRTWGSSGSDTAAGICLSSPGQLAVCGISGNNALLLQVSTALSVQWARQWGGGAAESFNDVGFDGSAYLYACGQTSSFGGNNSNGLLVKYDLLGNVQNSRTLSTNWWDILTGLAVRPDGNIYLAGFAQDAAALWGDADAVLADPDAVYDAPIGDVTVTNGTLTDAVGGQSVPIGTEDTGGGGGDTFISWLHSF